MNSTPHDNGSRGFRDHESNRGVCAEHWCRIHRPGHPGIPGHQPGHADEDDFDKDRAAAAATRDTLTRALLSSVATLASQSLVRRLLVSPEPDSRNRGTRQRDVWSVLRRTRADRRRRTGVGGIHVSICIIPINRWQQPSQWRIHHGSQSVRGRARAVRRRSADPRHRHANGDDLRKHRLDRPHGLWRRGSLSCSSKSTAPV